MPTDYDAIAGKYQRAKRQPWRGHIEAFTFFGMLGDLTGKTAVDLACGEGHYTRMLPGLGAVKVVGVDRPGTSPRVRALAGNRVSGPGLPLVSFAR
jgi:hypothetical protein